jgi:hypothetical protein
VGLPTVECFVDWTCYTSWTSSYWWNIES